MSSTFKLKSNLKKVLKDIDDISMERVIEAGKHTRKIMKKNASGSTSSAGGFPAKRSGRFRKSIKSRRVLGEREIKVGSTSSIVHLLEFGHGDGKSQNQRPIIAPSFRQAAPGVDTILSKSYWD